MTSPRSHAELVTLRKLAQDLAAQRKERLSSVHLLAAIALRGGPAADLLRDRRLDDEALLKATRSVDDEGPDPIGRAMGGARDVAKRSPSSERNAVPWLAISSSHATTAYFEYDSSIAVRTPSRPSESVTTKTAIRSSSAYASRNGW